MHSKPIIIRNARYTDLEDIAALDAYAFGQNAWSYNSFSRELTLRFSKLFVAECGLEFAGFALAWFIADEIQLMRIVIHREFRRCGIGSKLIHTIIDEADKQTKITLEVADNNPGAIEFYRSLGFYNVGFRKNYYYNDNAILMEMLIPR